MSKRLAIYPGSFDPITYGHVDVVKRGLAVFDEIIVLIADSSKKEGLFSVEEKKQLIETVFKDEPRVKVDCWQDLLMTYAVDHKAVAILRGLRAVSDFEYEFQMASMNKRLNAKIDTFFVMTSEQYHFVSSHLVREVAGLGGKLEGIVPNLVEDALKRKFKK